MKRVLTISSVILAIAVVCTSILSFGLTKNSIDDASGFEHSSTVDNDLLILDLMKDKVQPSREIETNKSNLSTVEPEIMGDLTSSTSDDSNTSNIADDVASIGSLTEIDEPETTLIETGQPAEESAETGLNVYVNEKLVPFTSEPKIVNDVIMVPMKEFFESLGAQVYWFEDTMEVVGYKNNMFVKLKIDHDTAYKNGKAYPLTESPRIIDGRTYVPLAFVAETFDMEITTRESDIYLTSKNRENRAVILDNSHYKKLYIDDFGISFSVPSFWTTIDETSNVYGYSDDYETYLMSIQQRPLSEGTTLKAFTDAYKIELIDNYGDSITFTGSGSTKANNIPVNIVYMTNTTSGKSQNQIVYLLVTENNGYIINCTYGGNVLEEDAIDQFNTIISTFSIDNMTLNLDEEHYIEYDNFFKYQFDIHSEIYSNMSVYNYFDLAGTINGENDFDHLLVEVSKDGETVEFIVNITDNQFSSKIYAPLGLGKHNVTVNGIVEKTVTDDIDTPDADVPAEENGNDTDSDIEKTESDGQETDEQELDSTEPSDQNSDDQPTSGETDEQVKDGLSETSDEETATEPSNTNEALENEKDPVDQLATEVTEETISDDDTIEASDQITSDDEVKIASTTTIKEKYPIMRFSMINISSEKIRYLIPSEKIDFNEVGVYSLANLLTYKSNSDYQKTKDIYRWLSENMVIVPDGPEYPRATSEIVLTDYATLEEINMLYVGLLRSIGIPAKVVKGDKDGETFYWTEVDLNGTWAVYSPGMEILHNPADDLSLSDDFLYFSIGKQDFYTNYENITEVSY